MGPFFILVPLLLLISVVLALVAISETREIRSILRSFPLQELTARVYKLEQRIAELQKKLASAAPPVPAPAPPVQAASEPVQPALNTQAQPTPQPPTPGKPPTPQALRPLPTLPKVAKEPSSADLEALIGGRWFNRIGIIAILFAVSYFLKLAFDNNWIGPAGRVATGIALGLLMLPWSDWLLSRDYTYFSEGIAGLGEGTLFVSVWAGCQYYTLFSRQTGFAALVAVTVVMAYLALRRNSQRIGFVSLLGGLLTPALMSSGKNEQVVLFSYLLLLGAAALYISWRREWQSLLPLAFGATYLYFWQWYDQFYSPVLLASTITFGTLIFLLFSVVPAARALLGLPLRVWDVLLVLANVLAFIAILYALLWSNYRWPLALVFVLLAIAHETIPFLLHDTDAEEASAPKFLYTGVAAACFTLAIPTKLEHNDITYAFTIEGAALVWIGFRYLGNLLRPFGYLLLALAVGHIFIDPPPGGAFLFNERFGTYLHLIAGLAVCLWGAISAISTSKPVNLSFAAESAKTALPLGSHLSRDPSRDTSFSALRSEAVVLTVAINFFALLALTQEFWDYFGGTLRHPGNSLAQHLSISILWTAYAGLLILLGMLRQLPILRWQALVLLGVVVLKVFFYDLSFLDRAYRILSFLILGAALLAVSFFYQRKLARERAG